MKQKWGNILSICIASCALGFSLWKVTPFEIGESTYIGIIATLIGIIVTIAIGYQIFNAIDITQRMTKFEKEQEEAINQINQLGKTFEDQKNELQQLYDKNITLINEINSMFFQLKTLHINIKDIEATLYSGLIISNNSALSVLIQLSIIEDSIEIDYEDEQFGMKKIFTYIEMINWNCFNNITTGDLKLDDYKNKVSDCISRIKEILKSKKLQIHELCIDEIENAIKIKNDMLTDYISIGSGKYSELEKAANNTIREIEEKYQNLFAKIN